MLTLSERGSASSDGTRRASWSRPRPPCAVRARVYTEDRLPSGLSLVTQPSVRESPGASSKGTPDCPSRSDTSSPTPRSAPHPVDDVPKDERRARAPSRGRCTRATALRRRRRIGRRQFISCNLEVARVLVGAPIGDTDSSMAHTAVPFCAGARVAQKTPPEARARPTVAVILP